MTEVVEKKDRSIHPRNWGIFKTSVKKNTMKKKDPNTIKRTITAIEAHLDVHPLDSMSQSRLSKLKKLV